MEKQSIDYIFDVTSEIYNQMTSSLSYDSSQIIRLFSDLGRILVHSDRSSFWRWDKENHLIVAEIAVGAGSIVVDDAKGIVGRCIRENKVIITNDPYNHPDFNPDVDKKTGYLTKSILVMPIKSFEGEVVGAYELINKLDSPEGFVESEDLRKLTIVAIVCALVLESRILQRQKVDSDASNKAKSAFLANMSHEIRTPINAVLGMDEMILRESREENILSYAKDIQTAGKTLLALINDILDFSKVEEGRMEIIPAEYDLGPMLNDLMNMVNERAVKKGLALSLDLDPNTPYLLFGDEIRIKQCILNLLINAVKYTEKGLVEIQISFSWKDDSNIYLKVRVSDTGIGMKKEDMDKLFAPFSRIEEERNRNIEGTGLGMSITIKLLKLMGSDLIVQSEYGEGSAFSFEVEQRVMSPEPIGSLQSHITVTRERGSKDTERIFKAPGRYVLVVDDNEMNLKVFEGLLKNSEMRIDKAASGEEGMGLINSNKYDMIFLDHKMPGMDGMDVMRKICENPEGLNRLTPIVALTANAIVGAREMYIAAGFTDFLTKPIQIDKLNELLEKYLPSDSWGYCEIKPFVTGVKADGAKILLVDDNAMNRKVFRELLKDLGVEIVEADCGPKALEFMKEKKFDIVFMDYMMPDMDGIEVLQELHTAPDNMNVDTPIIVVTASAIPGMREEMLQAGFSDFLTKPISFDGLLGVMKRHLPEEILKFQGIEEAPVKKQETGFSVEDDDFPEVDGVDWGYALLKIKDPEILRGIISDYIETADSDWSELEKHYRALISENDDSVEPQGESSEDALKLFEVKIHAMKSTSAMYGALAVSSLAKLLEYAAGAGDIARIKALMPIFMEEREKNLSSLKKAFAEGLEAAKTDAMEKPAIEPELLRQYLEMLGKAIDDLDIDASDFLMEELRKYSYSAPVDELIKELGGQVKNLDYDGVIGITNKIYEECGL
ncbi:MAG: response regulator [Lachnospiraceae bacterium]|nr:response regulator [Lachnospiraceae bacterium]